MKQIVAFILLVCSLYTHGFGQIPLSEKMTQTAIDKLFKDSVFVNNSKGPKWTYDMGVVLEGVAETWKIREMALTLVISNLGWIDLSHKMGRLKIIRRKTLILIISKMDVHCSYFTKSQKRKILKSLPCSL